MARLTISQEEFDSLTSLSKRELLNYIREKLLRKHAGRPAKGTALSGAERMKRYRERKTEAYG